ncbi:CUL3A [Symbiodinium natans]|uniref:CUL3A protein n=1 Tax=Symbiodinium natans TaxID=878477 RepID=A0A812TJM2_9DINO|nr:CUL3A [Symbiodinium natans]
MSAKPVAKGDAIELNLETMTVEQGLELIEKERVQPLLAYLRTGKFENKTNMTFMKAYSVVVQFGDQQQHSFKLYSYYKKVISDYCKDAMAQLQPLAGEDLLNALAQLWEKNTILVFWMQRVFQYLDRFFTKSSTEYPELFKAAVQAFSEHVFSKLKARCVDAMVAQVNRERDGTDIDQDVMRRLVEMLCTVGDTGPKVVKQKDGADKNAADRLVWQSQARGVYKTDFESKLLTTSSEYYRSKVAGWTAAYSCPQFLLEIQRRLDDEESRLSRYLDSTSEKELKTVVQKELILNTAKGLVEMSTGAQAMLTNRRYDELKLMYRIFKREPTMLPHIITAMEPYIETRARGVVEDPQMIDSPAAYTEKVLELKKEVDDMVASCFESDTGFQKGRNRGLEAVLNKDTRCAKYLALFCDLQLKKGLKGRNEDEVQTLVNQVVSLFAHLKDKDIFLDIYKSALSRRLLNKLSVSNDAEDCFITKLKVECGQQSIQKLASMFTDMALSDQLQEEYMKNAHHGSPGGVVHEVRVLQTNAWPEKADDVPIIPCPEMTTCITAYEAFYNSKHNGRKLRWIYNMGSVELKCHGMARPHLLVVSAYQCLCLVLFNQRQQVSLREICEATKLPEEECRRQVTSLTVSRHKVLLHDATGKDLGSETKLQVNDKFTNEKIKVAVSLIKKEEKAETTALAEAPVERKHVIDAAIVRIMKSRNKLEHNSLLDEVFRQCTLFKPQPAQIKSQIEHLIEREFLKRDDANRSIYLYLP